MIWFSATVRRAEEKGRVTPLPSRSLGASTKTGLCQAGAISGLWVRVTAGLEGDGYREECLCQTRESQARRQVWRRVRRLKIHDGGNGEDWGMLGVCGVVTFGEGGGDGTGAVRFSDFLGGLLLPRSLHCGRDDSTV